MDLINALLFVIPAYFANSAPVLARGKTPLDLGSKLKTNRVFGKSKTIRGAVVGILAGTIIGLLLAQTPYYFPSSSQKILIAFATSTGAIIGDLAGSFLKRRLKLKSGSPTFLLDQLPFLYLAIIAASLIQTLGLDFADVAFLTVLTLVLHPASNAIAHWLGLKSVPW